MNSAKATFFTSLLTVMCLPLTVCAPISIDTISTPQMPPSVIGPTRSLPRRYPSARHANSARTAFSCISFSTRASDPARSRAAPGRATERVSGA